MYFKSTIYFGCGKYERPIMIVPRLDKLLAKEKRSFYWLAKETGVSHTTLWRLKKGKSAGINFETLEKICRALRCHPGDVLFLSNDKILPGRRSLKAARKA
jgi:putative transcriptional regulator